MAFRFAGLSVAILSLFAAGCGGSAPQTPGTKTFKPINDSAAVFWDRQTNETANLIAKMAEEYNATRPGGLPIKVEYLGGYNDIYRKVSLSIKARQVPSMAVSYENMTAEYVLAGAVLDLGDFIHDPKAGLSADDLADFFPSVILTNTFSQFGNKMYSFPFCKSSLIMYFNKRVMAAAGITDPPKTWDEFLAQCRQIKSKTGKFAYALDADCSTIDGMIFSMGGEIASGNKTLYDAPASVKALQLLETLAKEKLAYQIQVGTFDDREAFAHDEVAFFFRSSSHKSYTEMLMQGAQDAWGMAMTPQDDPSHPVTVLYGPNICIFHTNDEQQKAAWGFVKYFTSRDVSVRWALASGYVPIRKSAAKDPAVQAFWAKWKYNRAAFDCLEYARPEPNLVGWQQVRSLVEQAIADVMAQSKTATVAAASLKKDADAVLASQAQP